MMEKDRTYWRDHIAALVRQISMGSVDAMEELGVIYQNGMRDSHGRCVVRPRPRVAVRLMTRAAKRGCKSVSANIGFAYDIGSGVRKNRQTALKWYRRAWRTGDSTAATNSATVHRDANNLRLAFKWYMKAAEKGRGDEALDLGYCYQYGIGVRPNLNAAKRLYHRAIKCAPRMQISEDGRAEAMCHLAVIHLDHGSRQAAVPLLRRATAGADYPEAESLLRSLRIKEPIRVCRCRRGLRKELPGHAACILHQRRNGATCITSAPAAARQKGRP